MYNKILIYNPNLSWNTLPLDYNKLQKNIVVDNAVALYEATAVILNFRIKNFYTNIIGFRRPEIDRLGRF